MKIRAFIFAALLCMSTGFTAYADDYQKCYQTSYAQCMHENAGESSSCKQEAEKSCAIL